MAVTGRFAPSPTGALHLGHAYSALLAWDSCGREKPRFRLRIEDLDPVRSRQAAVAAIVDDLRWLGIAWQEPVLVQSGQFGRYAEALKRLGREGLLYRCTCTRREIAQALEAPQEGVLPRGVVYPGTCRPDRAGPLAAAEPDQPYALRLNLGAALARLQGRHLAFEEVGTAPDGAAGMIAVNGEALLEGCGDVVLARKDVPASYHLAVVLDDAAQGVTEVCRGQDLFAATPIHRLLQELLALPVPRYRHHRLIGNDQGERLAKRDQAASLAALRAAGVTPDGLRRRLDLAPADNCPSCATA